VILSSKFINDDLPEKNRKLPEEEAETVGLFEFKIAGAAMDEP